MDTIVDELYEAVDINTDEIDIVFNSSPPAIIKIDTKIGISYEVIKPLMKYAMKSFLSILQDCGHHPSRRHEELMKLMVSILIIKGDMPLILNVRRRLLLGNSNTYDDANEKKIKLDNELNFISLILDRHPKSPSLWEYRRFILYLSNTNSSELNLNKEFLLCDKMCDKYARNYYGWNHRLWLLQYTTDNDIQIELNRLKKWIKSHPSDHSAISYHVQIINKYINDHIFDDNNNDTKFILITNLFNENLNILQIFPEYESQWLHRRMLFLIYLQYFQPNKIKLNEFVDYEINHLLSTTEYNKHYDSYKTYLMFTCKKKYPDTLNINNTDENLKTIKPYKFLI